MQDKIVSNLVKTEGRGDLREKYEEIYRDAEVWLYRRSQGLHMVITGQLQDRVAGASVLDVGCGAGRLALGLGRQAQRVDGIDFSGSAIAIARHAAECCAATNVAFHVADIDSFVPSESYDLITLVGVLEHVPAPSAVMARLNRWLRPGGTLVVSCPNFLNWRGHTYMTLLTLFDLPMSLADLHQIDLTHVRDWSARTGFAIERSVGALYRSVWDEKAVQDMVKRVPAAVRDKQLDVPLHFDAYNAWLHSSLALNQQYLAYLEQDGILRRIERVVDLPVKRRGDVPDALFERLESHLWDDTESDPYYT